MEIQTLMNCVAQLKLLRDTKYSQLDASIRLELDEVIAQLEKACDGGASEVQVDATSKRALELFGLLVEVTTNLMELVKTWFGD